MESFEESSSAEQLDEMTEDLKERFIQKYFDQRMEQAIPHIAKAYAATIREAAQVAKQIAQFETGTARFGLNESDLKIQSASVSMTIGREPIRKLGKAFAFTREITFPINAQLTSTSILDSVTITDPGSGYSQAPAVIITGGGGTGSDGANSVFGALTAIGGGGGAGDPSYNGRNGGSGGGGKYGGLGGTGNSGQGFAGGSGTWESWKAGGGGGAGGVGVDGVGSPRKSGDGGPGLGFNISGTFTYYAGGGGGGRGGGGGGPRAPRI